MGGEELEKRLWEKVPRKKQFCDEGTCKDLADFFAQIVDYKFEFENYKIMNDYCSP